MARSKATKSRLLNLQKGRDSPNPRNSGCRSSTVVINKLAPVRTKPKKRSSIVDRFVPDDFTVHPTSPKKAKVVIFINFHIHKNKTNDIIFFTFCHFVAKTYQIQCELKFQKELTEIFFREEEVIIIIIIRPKRN